MGPARYWSAHLTAPGSALHIRIVSETETRLARLVATPALQLARRAHLAAAAVFIVVTSVMLGPVLRGQTLSEVETYQSWAYPWAGSATATHANQGTLMHWDQIETFYPWQVFMNGTLRSGALPLWNPFEFGGIPFFANATNGLLYPPRLVLSLLVSPVRVHDLLALSHMFAAGLATYWMLVWFRRSWAASVLGACAWMTCSFLLAWLALEHFLIVAVWMPVALVLIDWSIRRRSVGATLTLTLTLAMLYLGGNALFVELTFIALAAFAAATMVGEAREARRTNESPRKVVVWGAAAMCAACVATLGLVAIQLVPNLELLGRTARSGLSYSELGTYALPRALLRSIFLPPELPAAPDFLHTVYHEALFAGTPTALLAVIGLVARARLAAFARALAVVVVLLMLHTPVTYFFYRVLPGFDSFKPLARAAFLLCFALAVLAAFGFDRLAAFVIARRMRGGAITLAALALSSLIVTVAQAKHLAEQDLRTQPPVEAAMFPSTPLIDAIKTKDHPRVLPLAQVLRGSSPMLYEILSAAGYESLVPRRVVRYWQVVGGATPQGAETTPLNFAYFPQYQPDTLRYDLLARAGVTDIATLPDTRLPDTARALGRHSPQLRYDGTDGRLFVLPAATGLATVVGSCRGVVGEHAQLLAFTKRVFDAERSLLLDASPNRLGLVRYCNASASKIGSARVVGTGVESFRATATLRRPGMLLVRINAYPGWRARVDGKPARLIPADYLFQAVPLEAGRHVVELSFQPRSVKIGEWISAVTLVGLVTVAGIAAARRQRTRPA